jgi:hypothetical protein
MVEKSIMCHLAPADPAPPFAEWKSGWLWPDLLSGVDQ